MTPVRRRVAVTGAGVWNTGNLAALLDDCELLRVRPWRATATSVDAVLAWGRKPSASIAAAYAQRHGLPLLHVEDGFLRSLELGADAPPLSLVVDDLGIYYDARTPSRLESLIAAGLDDTAVARAEALRQAWCAARVSKYNHARDDALGAPLPERYVLVVDQTAGDASIAGGLADAESFRRMLAAALADHPDATVLLKVHPDVVAGRKQGHFDVAALAREPRIRLVADAVHPVVLIENARAVYVVTSQMGFEALLHGKRVHTFGMPFYAGWGLTQDALPPPGRRQPASLAALIHAALIAYPRYLDPETGVRCEPERLVAWMGMQRQMRGLLPPRLLARNFSPWKVPVLRRFLAGSRISFRRDGWWRRAGVPAGSTVAVWGRPADGVVPGAARTLIVEDGFLRSVGLGADLVQPLSWVIDDTGIYYDATRPSRLENLLQDDAQFDDVLRARAAALRRAVRGAGITKYNLAGRQWQRPSGAKRVLLVPGQVEGDASIVWGAAEIRSNIELLRAVRAANPDAWLVYKPHPDVLAGLRPGGAGESGASALCDEIVSDVPMHALLEAVDEIHVLTSLAGFEGLLRNKPVTCWGRPFYAGWGLTQDRAPLPRRTSRRTLDELVAATLILYPRYVSRASGAYTTPERALEELINWRDRGADPFTPWRRIKRTFMRARARLLQR